MQLSELLAGVYDRMGVNQDDPMYPAAVVTRAVNSALRQLGTVRDWPWLEAETTFATESGEDTYAPPAGWSGTTALVIVGGGGVTKLERASRDEIDELFTSTGTGRPAYWTIYGDEIILRPTPDGVYSITHRFVRAEQVLAQTTDEPYLPDAYADAVCDLATHICLGRSSQDARAVQALARYSGWLSDMADNRRRTRRPSRVRVRPGGWL